MATAETLASPAARTASYARCIELSKKVRWDIDRDIIRGRELDASRKFLPDGLSLVDRLDFLDAADRRFLSQVQGRTYANLFGLIERYINAKVLEVSQDHWFGDQVALEALIRFSDEELKHQELFRRIEELAARVMPDGYRNVSDPNEVAKVVLARSTWAVLALTCHVEIFTQVHFKKSIEPQDELSPLWKDVFLFHWKEECQHAVLDELEWRREDERLTDAERDKAVDDLIALVVAVDGILQQQSAADADYFVATGGRSYSDEQEQAIRQMLLKAYRWQYIVSGIQDGKFLNLLLSMITEQQAERITGALGPLME
ncbi:MAG: hypothetical protein R3315_03200 [Woeseiaceae bacterium]|nr:hypothetical protein [Woeseiaceae bacterium]